MPSLIQNMTRERATIVLLGLCLASFCIFFIYFSYLEAFATSEQLIEGIKYKVVIHDGIGSTESLRQP